MQPIQKLNPKSIQFVFTDIDDTLTRRIDGLNNQLEILAASGWRRFIEEDDSAVGRSWAFQARPEEIQEFLEQTIRSLRHSAIDLEESAMSSGDGERYGITVAFARTKE